jgi:hypothetical protein
MSCGYECGCDSIEEHDAAREREEAAFLSDPGSPPAGWSEDRIAKARAAMDEAREVRRMVADTGCTREHALGIVRAWARAREEKQKAGKG